MQPEKQLPDWIALRVCRALLGEIYPQIRAIAVAFDSLRRLTIRYYLDRPPTDYDYESVGCVMTNVLSETSSDDEISAVTEECYYSELPFGEIDPLDGLVYARYEE